MAQTCRPILVFALAVFLTGCRDHARPFGEPVSGLALWIRVERDTFGFDSPLLVYPAFINLSQRPIVLWQCSFWPNTRVEATDASGRPVNPTACGVAKRELFCPGGERQKNLRVELGPGHTYAGDPVDIRTLFDFKPNADYVLQLVYEENLPEGWRGRLPSNRIRILLTEREMGTEKKWGHSGEVTDHE